MTTTIRPDQGLATVRQDNAEWLFAQPVPPRLVRRTHQADVFVTNLRVTGGDGFEVSVRMPAEHRFYGPSGGWHDPMLLVECVREAGLLVAHFVYDIPRASKFVTHSLRFAVDPAGLVSNVDEPVDLTLRLTQHDIVRRGRRIAGMRTQAECLRDGKRFGTVTYNWSVVSAPAYKKLRGCYDGAEPAMPRDAIPVAPERVGRVDEIDVLLAERPDGPGWQVRVDPAHPVIYDHSIDHVPGNAVVEVVRQAALLVSGRPDALPVGGDFEFSHYLEFDSPCVVSAEPVGGIEGRTGIRYLVEQDDRRSVEGVLELQSC